MPRPQHPPTPVSSTEIKSKDGSQYPSLQMSFELPPPAVAGSGSQSSSASRKTSTASSYQPGSPTSPATASEVVKTRRRSSIVPVPAKDAFALPPPPTRSRKIIQMKPRGQNDAAEEEVVDTVTAKTGTKATTGSKKKPPSSTSVAGRKIARKTAHSLIERRRRSKMNEEFGVLKDMIPACTGDMHKLAILQACLSSNILRICTDEQPGFDRLHTLSRRLRFKAQGVKCTKSSQCRIRTLQASSTSKSGGLYPSTVSP